MMVTPSSNGPLSHGPHSSAFRTCVAREIAVTPLSVPSGKGELKGHGGGVGGDCEILEVPTQALPHRWSVACDNASHYSCPLLGVDRAGGRALLRTASRIRASHGSCHYAARSVVQALGDTALGGTLHFHVRRSSAHLAPRSHHPP